MQLLPAEASPQEFVESWLGAICWVFAGAACCPRALASSIIPATSMFIAVIDNFFMGVLSHWLGISANLRKSACQASLALPQVKALQALHSGKTSDRKQQKPKYTKHRQAKIDIDVREQLALDRDLALKQL